MYGPLSEKLFSDSHKELYQYREEPFLLASGNKSNHYFNCKKITLIPSRLEMLASAVCDELLPTENLGEIPAAGGLTLGADPIAVALSLAFLKRGKTVYPLIVRKEAKSHGTGAQIEGEWGLVKSALVLDDVVTTGGSTQKAVDAFRKAGLEIKAAVCIVDRQEGGREALLEQGVKLYSVFKKSDFL